MTVLSKFSRLTGPELSYWSKLPQDVLEMVLKQPQLVARENFDACMREFMYKQRPTATAASWAHPAHHARLRAHAAHRSSSP
jgi:hypothetical protein